VDWVTIFCIRILPFFGPCLPNDSEIWLSRGRSLAAEEEYNRAIEAFAKAIRFDRNNVAGYEGQGDAYLGKGDFQLALVDYSQALRLLPKGTAPVDHARLLSKRRDAYFRLEDFDRALADQSEVIRLVPNVALSYLDRSQIYVSQKKYQLALNDIAQAMRLEPRFVLGYITRASV
jgi:tetratricopeptide (TPR) repeat protein